MEQHIVDDIAQRCPVDEVTYRTAQYEREAYAGDPLMRGRFPRQPGDKGEHRHHQPDETPVVRAGEHRKSDTRIMCAKQRQERQQNDLLMHFHAGLDHLLDDLVGHDHGGANRAIDQKRPHQPVTFNAERRIS